MAQNSEVEIKFLDKKFRLTIREPNERDRIIFFDGHEARKVFNRLDSMINARPQSEDDRLSLEQQAAQSRAPAQETTPTQPTNPVTGGVQPEIEKE